MAHLKYENYRERELKQRFLEMCLNCNVGAAPKMMREFKTLKL